MVAPLGGEGGKTPQTTKQKNKKLPEPHETQEKLIKKMHVVFKKINVKKSGILES